MQRLYINLRCLIPSIRNCVVARNQEKSRIYRTSRHPSLHISREPKKKRIGAQSRHIKTEEDGSFKKFSHKKDITQDIYYNVICGDVVEMIQKVPKKESTLLIADIPYGFRMVGSSYDDEPFRFKQLEKMFKDFVELTTASLWRIVVFHSMDQGYSVAQALRSRCHRIEKLARKGLFIILRQLLPFFIYSI